MWSLVHEADILPGLPLAYILPLSLWEKAAQPPTLQAQSPAETLPPSPSADQGPVLDTVCTANLWTPSLPVWVSPGILIQSHTSFCPTLWGRNPSGRHTHLTIYFPTHLTKGHKSFYPKSLFILWESAWLLNGLHLKFSNFSLRVTMVILVCFRLINRPDCLIIGLHLSLEKIKDGCLYLYRSLGQAKN